METRRTSDLLSYLVKKKQATSKELCTHLHCSISTLRRELLELEKRKIDPQNLGRSDLERNDKHGIYLSSKRSQ